MEYEDIPTLAEFIETEKKPKRAIIDWNPIVSGVLKENKELERNILGEFKKGEFSKDSPSAGKLYVILSNKIDRVKGKRYKGYYITQYLKNTFLNILIDYVLYTDSEYHCIKE